MTLVFILYLILLMVIVFFSAKRSKTNADFVIGGKKLSGYSLALSERATGESAWLLLGLTGHAYAGGLSSIWIALGCIIGIFFIWWVMAKPLQEIQEKTDALTLPSLFTYFFPEHKRRISLITSLILIFFFMIYIASQFSGAGKIFQNTFGLDPLLGMLIGSLLVTFYTMLGGFITVVATDAFQALLMAFTCIVLPIVAYFICIANGIDLSGIVHGNLSASQSGISTTIFSSMLIFNGLSWALGHTGQPQLLMRMMALKNSSDTSKARIVALIWTLLAYSGAFAIGLVGYKMVQSGYMGNVAQTLARDSEKILPTMVVMLLNPLLAGVLLSGAVSAMMSTASSQLMVASTAISEDLIESMKKKHFSQKKKLLINKVLILVVGGMAFLMAISMSDTVYGLVSYAWAGIGSSFGPAIILLLFWKRFSVAGLYGSLLGGSLSAVLWKLEFYDTTGLSERLVSYVFALFLAVSLTMLFPKKQ